MVFGFDTSCKLQCHLVQLPIMSKYYIYTVLDIAAFSSQFARGAHRETSLSTALVLLGCCSDRMQGCRALGRDSDWRGMPDSDKHFTTALY